jgi:hypothetical protein
MKRSCGNLESCHRDDRQTVLPQQALKPEHLQAEYRINGERGVRKIFIFSKLNRFSNMVILAYIITIDFPIWFTFFLEIIISLLFIV